MVNIYKNPYLPAYTPGDYGSVYSPIDATTQALANDLKRHYASMNPPEYEYGEDNSAGYPDAELSSWENEGGKTL